MIGRIFSLLPKSIFQHPDLHVVKIIACDVSGQVPKLMGWSVPLGLLGKLLKLQSLCFTNSTLLFKAVG